MSTIAKSVDQAQGITKYVFTGKLLLEEVLDTLREFYSRPTQYLIWDITEADLSGASNDDLKKIVALTKPRASIRSGGKTAILGDSDLQYGLGRMYATFSELENHPVDISVFRNIDNALLWFKSQDDTW